MSQNNRLTMRLQGATPDSISLSMLGEYLKVLASIYGHKNEIIFGGLTEGSVCINSYANSEKIYLQVISRARSQMQPGKENYEKLVSILTRDNLSAEIISNDNVIIGTIKPEAANNTQEIHKKSKVQGRLYSIGGKGESINIKIQGANNENYICTTTVGLATQLSQYLFKYIRVQGMSTWEKKKNTWTLKNLIIEKYQELEETTLLPAINSVAKVKGNKWNSDENHDETIRKMRDSD